MKKIGKRALAMLLSCFLLVGMLSVTSAESVLNDGLTVYEDSYVGMPSDLEANGLTVSGNTINGSDFTVEMAEGHKYKFDGTNGTGLTWWCTDDGARAADAGLNFGFEPVSSGVLKAHYEFWTGYEGAVGSLINGTLAEHEAVLAVERKTVPEGEADAGKVKIGEVVSSGGSEASPHIIDTIVDLDTGYYKVTVNNATAYTGTLEGDITVSGLYFDKAENANSWSSLHNIKVSVSDKKTVTFNDASGSLIEEVEIVDGKVTPPSYTPPQGANVIGWTSEDGTVVTDFTNLDVVVGEVYTVKLDKAIAISVNVANETELVDAINNASTEASAQTNIILTDNISVTGRKNILIDGKFISFSGDKTITLNMRAGNYTEATGNEAFFRIRNGSQVVFNDVDIDANSGNGGYSNCLFIDNSTVTLKGNSELRNGGKTYGTDGTAVGVKLGTFIMEDNSKITGTTNRGNANEGMCSVIYLNQSNFIMNGGEISGNHAGVNGVIYANPNNTNYVELNNGRIVNNTYASTTEELAVKVYSVAALPNVKLQIGGDMEIEGLVWMKLSYITITSALQNTLNLRDWPSVSNSSVNVNRMDYQALKGTDTYTLTTADIGKIVGPDTRKPYLMPQTNTINTVEAGANIPAEGIEFGGKLTVTFVDYDGTELKVEEVEEGSGATAPQNPTRLGYIFNGWDKTFDNITADTTVTATYIKNAKFWYETFDEETPVFERTGNPLIQNTLSSVNYGTMMMAFGAGKSLLALPQAAKAGKVNISFDIMRKNDVTAGYAGAIVSGDVDAPTVLVPLYIGMAGATGGEAIYTTDDSGNNIILKEIKDSYKWFDVSFTVDMTNRTYSGTDASGNPFTAKFKADGDVAGLYFGEAKAPGGWVSFDNVAVEVIVSGYTVTFYDGDGTTVLDTQVVDSGQAVSYGGSVTPTKADDGVHSYTFAGWDKDLTNVTENLSVYPVFTEGDPAPRYAVTFYDGDMTTPIDTQNIIGGGSAVAPEVIPAKATDDTYKYIFTGWDKAFDNITAELQVYPVFRAVNKNAVEVTTYAELSDAITTAPTDGQTREIIVMNDIDVSGQLSVPNGANIVLSGGKTLKKIWNSESPLINLNNKNGAATLVIDDIIIDMNAAELGKGGRALYVYFSQVTAKGNTEIKNGLVTNNDSAVYISGGTAKFIMEDNAKITGFAPKSGATETGIIGFYYGGQFVMNGGEISGNTIMGNALTVPATASTGNAGGGVIYIANDTTGVGNGTIVELNGGKIKNNSWTGVENNFAVNISDNNGTLKVTLGGAEVEGIIHTNTNVKITSALQYPVTVLYSRTLSDSGKISNGGATSQIYSGTVLAEGTEGHTLTRADLDKITYADATRYLYLDTIDRTAKPGYGKIYPQTVGELAPDEEGIVYPSTLAPEEADTNCYMSVDGYTVDYTINPLEDSERSVMVIIARYVDGAVAEAVSRKITIEANGTAVTDSFGLTGNTGNVRAFMWNANLSPVEYLAK